MVEKLKIILYSCIIIFIFIFIFSINLFAQNEFRKIKYANDVIENYLNAIGGKDKLTIIKSLFIVGKANIYGLEIPYSEFIGDGKYYLNFGNDTIEGITFVINDTIRWAKTYEEGKEIIYDVSDDFHKPLDKYFLSYNFFYFFLNFDHYGFILKLDSIITPTKNLYYKITFSKNDSVICSCVFDSKNFYLKNYTVEAPTENIMGSNQLIYKFDDYREINRSNIKLPFTIVRNEVISIEISKYTFNAFIEDSLLQRPIGDTLIQKPTNLK